MIRKLLGGATGAFLSLHPRVKFHPPVRVDGRLHLRIMRGSKLHVGRGVRFFPGCRIHIDSPNAEVVIGAGTYLNRRVQIYSESEVSIGQNCAISWDVTIMDTDYHDGISPKRSMPVTIGDHVLIGAGSTVLKGITIGNGAVVGAGSIVTQNVPSGSMVVGVPARVVRENVEWS